MKNLLFLITLLLSFSSLAQKKSFKMHHLKSAALSEKRSLWVGLPTNYHPKRRYDVVYVLDAEDRFEITHAVTKELHENHQSIPEVIVVGIPNIDKVKRLKDMTFTASNVNATGLQDTMGYFCKANTGNGELFLSFLETEVVPFINKHYRTTNINTLIGHSIGGYFCTYIIPTQKTFKTLQIYDPSIWYNQGDAIRQIEQQLDSSFARTVFISKGTAFDGPRQLVNNHLNMIDSLSQTLVNYSSIKLDTASFEKDHNAMFIHSLIEGIPEGYKE